MYTSLGSIELASDDLHSKRLYTVRNGYASKFAANAAEYIEKYVISSCIFRAESARKKFLGTCINEPLTSSEADYVNMWCTLL